MALVSLVVVPMLLRTHLKGRHRIHSFGRPLRHLIMFTIQKFLEKPFKSQLFLQRHNSRVMKRKLISWPPSLLLWMWPCVALVLYLILQMSASVWIFRTGAGIWNPVESSRKPIMLHLWLLLLSLL